MTEIDIIIGEKIFGWHHDETYWFSADGELQENYSNSHDEEVHEFSPSTDLNDAFRVVEHFKAQEYYFALVLDAELKEKQFFCHFEKYDSDIGDMVKILGVREDTAALAICQAAIKTIRKE